MVTAGEVVEGDTVVEIGPGKGALTKVLLETGAIVIAFEKDHRLIELLNEMFAEYVVQKKFFLYEKDILDVNIEEYLLEVSSLLSQSSSPRTPKEHFYFDESKYVEQESNITERKQSDSKDSNHESLHNTPSRDIPSGLDSRLRGNDDTNVPYKLIANIPYYITGEITRRFLTHTYKPSIIVLLVQKEVANRIVDTKETILSLSIKIFGTPKKVMIVKKEHFSPSPKVDSAIIKISNIKVPFQTKEEENYFFTIIKKAFGQKRKKLNTTLKEYKDTIKDWETIKEKRPEELHVEDWINLFT